MKTPLYALFRRASPDRRRPADPPAPRVERFGSSFSHRARRGNFAKGGPPYRMAGAIAPPASITTQRPGLSTRNGFAACFDVVGAKRTKSRARFYARPNPVNGSPGQSCRIMSKKVRFGMAAGRVQTNNDSETNGNAAPGLSGSLEWRNSARICALTDGERHIGHIVKNGRHWQAFDASRRNEAGDGFRFLGTFAAAESARQAVERSYSPVIAVLPRSEAGPGRAKSRSRGV